MAVDTSGGVSLVEPILDEKPWGGRRLASYGFALPDDTPIGEALVTASSARLTSGSFAGSVLGDTVLRGPDAVLGRHASAMVGGRPIFPLLVKLIDASENLSIQVHPGDTQAAQYGQPGKTEAWHVLAAEPGSWLYAGLREGVRADEFLRAADLRDGSSASLLRRIPAEPGMTILLPAGTVHALGAGVMVYEIQQPSDLTFRLDDWGRVDADGNPRSMHREAGAAAMQTDLRPSRIAPVELPANEGRRHMLAACDKFALERIALSGGGRYHLASMNGPQVLTVLSGNGQVGNEALASGQSGVIWPNASRVTLEASEPIVALRCWVPHLASDLKVLTSMPGIDVGALRGLSGPLPDARQALET